ncbi:putative quinol monooxygenase [Glaciibacter sp. 2TAF33]|uniref:putative quinol monooxygenase n=1 Tax=Glaciibacter sp. 2TAF33 TaxID=3233015 RepID=UPI003F8FB5B7
MALVCIATWTAKPGSEDIVRGALAELTPATRTEPGNIYYQPYADPEAPNVFRIFEVYTDADAFEAHGKSAHFAEFALGRAIPELEGRVRETYETLDF